MSQDAWKETQICLENKHRMERFEQTVVDFLSLSGFLRRKYSINVCMFVCFSVF